LKKKLLDLQIQSIDNKYSTGTDKSLDIDISDFNKNKITKRIVDVSLRLNESDRLYGDSSYKLNDLENKQQKLIDDMSIEENRLNYQFMNKKSNDQLYNTNKNIKKNYEDSN
jgi:coenzyme F420-reducing hydrogenase delta subunit